MLRAITLETVKLLLSMNISAHTHLTGGADLHV